VKPPWETALQSPGGNLVGGVVAELTTAIPGLGVLPLRVSMALPSEPAAEAEERAEVMRPP